MKIIMIVEEKRNHAEHAGRPSLAAMEAPAVERWLRAHRECMPLVMLTQQGKPAVVADIDNAGRLGLIENQASLRMLEKQLESLYDVWTDWCSRAR